MSLVTYDDIVANEELRTYILKADEALKAIGYTEHAFANMAGRPPTPAICCWSWLRGPHRRAGRIAGYMHDIGNVVNRVGHAQSGALMAFRIWINGHARQRWRRWYPPSVTTTKAPPFRSTA
jgi:hypothetical protein